MERNLTQRELADLLQVRVNTVSMWETNNDFPNQVSRDGIAELLGITVPRLVRARVKMEYDDD